LSLRNWVQHNLLNPTDVYIVFYGLFIPSRSSTSMDIRPLPAGDTIRKQGGYHPLASDRGAD